MEYEWIRQGLQAMIFLRLTQEPIHPETFQKDPQKALNLFNLASAIPPHSSLAMGSLVALNAILQVHPTAGENGGASDNDASSELLLLVQGKTHSLFGDREQAVSKFNDCLSINPHNAEALYHKGLLAFMKPSPSEAVRCLDAACRSDPANFEYKLGLALTLGTFRRREEAEELLEEIMDETETALTAAAVTGAAENNRHSSSSSSASLVSIYCRAATTLGSELMSRSDTLEQVEGEEMILEAASRMNPQTVRAENKDGLLKACNIFFNRQQYDEALAVLELAELLDARDAEVLSKLVQCYQALDKTTRRDAIINRLYQLHKLGMVSSDHFCREQIVTERGTVLALEFYDTKFGAKDCKYKFVWNNENSANDDVVTKSTINNLKNSCDNLSSSSSLDRKTNEAPDFTSLASSDEINRSLWESGQCDRDLRVWHIDANYSTSDKGDGTGKIRTTDSSKTLKVLSPIPPYDTIRKDLLSGLLGNEGNGVTSDSTE